MDDNPPAPPPTDGLDLWALQAELRQRALRGGVPVLGTPTLARHLIAANLEQIKQHLEVGQGLPQFGRFALLRPLARLLARGLLFCLRFLTNRLRRLHHAQLNTLQHLQRGLDELERRTRQDQQNQSAEFHTLLEQRMSALESQHRQEMELLRRQVEELRRNLPTSSRRAA